MEVVYNSELLEVNCVLDHLLLDLLHLIIVIVENLDRYFVSIIVQVDEPVVEEEATVAFLAITIIDLLSSLNIVKCFNDESASVISVVPCGLTWTSMVEHIGIGDETICLYTLDLNAEDSAGDHHTNL